MKFFQHWWRRGLAPQESGDPFQRWWRRASRRAGKEARRGVNSLIILTVWHMWRYRNRAVFDGEAPRVQVLVTEIKEEAKRWALSGAKQLCRLLSYTGVPRLL
ncbi:hypothetical protein QOZ80_1BG0048490 [Eleusine coracana subsp. coracana]|nr:hypothetical protein QOZ80_1BG0048490 [Eleusine coracana subsp. coracana]